MRAITYSHFGSTDTLSLTDAPSPHPGPDTVIVRVHASGVNPVDWKAREGYLEGLIDTIFPAIPGWDLAGVVTEVGADTPNINVGDEVYAYNRMDIIQHGSLAEFAPVPVRALATKPKSISFEQAAAVPLAGLTALQSIRRMNIDASDTVLIHGASGGVGSFGTQLAVLTGATVVAVSSPAHHERLRGWGAMPISYGDTLVAEAKQYAPDGFTAIIDYAGNNALASTPELIDPTGRILSITHEKAPGAIPTEVLWVRPDPSGLRELASLIDAEKLEVPVAKVFDLADAGEAHRLSESGHAGGKIVVRI